MSKDTHHIHSQPTKSTAWGGNPAKNHKRPKANTQTPTHTPHPEKIADRQHLSTCSPLDPLQGIRTRRSLALSNFAPKTSDNTPEHDSDDLPTARMPFPGDLETALSYQACFPHSAPSFICHALPIQNSDSSACAISTQQPVVGGEAA